MDKSRVTITNIQPVVEGGLYKAKAIQNEALTISASIFTDGHNEIAASAFIKGLNDKQWLEVPLELTNNDHWGANYTAREQGIHQFKIHAWPDHFATWLNALKKKITAGQDVNTDIKVGLDIIGTGMTRGGKYNKQLKSLIEEIPQLDPAQTVSRLGTIETLQLIRDAVLRKDLAKSDIYEYEVERVKAGFSTWYEIFPRSASPEEGRHGTFKDVEKLLPRISSMGFDVLYFPPIHPIGEKKRKGKNNSLTATENDPGSPWAIGSRQGGHKSIHPELGTIDEFRELVKAASDHNVEIAMDIAFQCAPDHPYVTEHPDWFNWRPDGTVQYAENPPKKYEDILPLNFDTEDREGLWQELKSVVEYWIGNGINIFRVDNPHTKAFPFWEWMIGEIRRHHPQVIFLAEAFTRPRIMEHLAKIGFNQSYTYFTWRNSKTELEEYLTELTKTPLKYYFRPNFWPNTPDILPPELSAGGEAAHIIRVILAATMSSNYGIYGPVYEFGMTAAMPGKEEYIDNEKYEIRNWNWNQYTRIGEIISRLNSIRKENKALQSTYNIEFAETTNEQIVCYTKMHHETNNILIIAVNLDPYHTQSASVKIPISKARIKPGTPYNVHDLLSGDKYVWQDEWNYVQLAPNEMPAHLFKVEQH